MIVLNINTKLPPILDEIPNTLESLQQIVGGYIEPCAPAELRAEGIELLCNEEGLLTGLEPNENLSPFFIVGNAVAVAVIGEDFGSLTPRQVKYLVEWLDSLKR